MDDFLVGKYFVREDVCRMIHLFKTLIMNLIMTERRTNTLDEFVLYSGSVLLRILFNIFTFENFIPAKEWVIEDLDWKAIKKYEMFDESKHTSASNLFL